MAAGIPAIAWIENSALVFVLAAAGALAIVVVAVRLWRDGRRRAAEGDRQGAPD